jgi:hypothetical protein
MKTYFMGKVFHLDHIQPIKNEESCLNKPKGGLWTSPNHEWKEWCRGEMPHWITAEFELEINESNLLIVDNIETTLQLKLKPLSKLLTYYNCIDFEYYASLYSGLWIKPFHNWRFLSQKGYSLFWNSWDCETILIFDKTIIQSWKQVS